MEKKEEKKVCCICGKAVSYTHLDVYKRQREDSSVVCVVVDDVL